jgi:hypothetical protein
VQTLPAAIDVPASADNVFRCDGDYWSVVFDGRTIHLRDSRGLQHLARLLAKPGLEFHVLDLVVTDRADSAGARHATAGATRLRDVGDAGELLDGRAKQAYRRRLAEIDDDLTDARALGDASRVAQASAERDFLARELSRAVGLGGRDRRAGFAAERARASVTRAVRQAMRRIGEQHPPLGAHLERAVRTGAYCAYLPDPRVPVAWTI